MSRFSFRRQVGTAWFWACSALLPATAAQADSLTLAQALQQAEAANLTLQSTQANLMAAQGQLKDARGLFWNNPEIEGERVRRSIAGTTGGSMQKEWSAGLSQTFEVAGQQGYRREAAEQDLTALQATLDDTRRQLRAVVEQRFIQVLSLQQQVAAEASTLTLVEESAAVAQKRVKVGEDSRLNGNLALVEAEQARNQLAALREQLTQARAELADVLQLPPDSLPEVTGDLATPPPAYTLAQLLEAAATRPQLQALAAREAAAQSRLRLEKASTYPDITLGVRTAREGPAGEPEKVTGLSVSLPLPLFRRNATGIGQAQTELVQAQLERQDGNRDIRAQVQALWLKVQSLQERVKRLTASVQPSLDENRQLSAKSYQAGEIGLLELILVNRQVLEGQRSLLEAQAELHQAQVELEAVAGWSETRP